MSFSRESGVLVCYGYAAFLTLIQVGIIISQRRQFRRMRLRLDEIDREMGLLKERLSGISDRLDALEAKRRRKNAA